MFNSIKAVENRLVEALVTFGREQTLTFSTSHLFHGSLVFLWSQLSENSAKHEMAKRVIGHADRV